MYLEAFRKREPARIATATSLVTNGAAPTLVGSNYIHPTARIHFTAKVWPERHSTFRGGRVPHA